MNELIATFTALVDEYAKHRDYIQKAKAQAAKFSPAVIEKVILDHEIKSSAAAEAVLPHVGALVQAIGAIDAEKAEIDQGRSGSVEQMEELELRLAIGEIEDAEFQDLAGNLRQTLDGAASRVQALDDDRQGLQAALDRWVSLADAAGQDTGVPSASAPAAPAAPVAEVAEASEESAADDTIGDVILPEPPAAEEPQEEVIEVEGDAPVVTDVAIGGEHSAVTGMREDVSAVFDDAPAAVAERAVSEEENLIEVAEASADEPSADVDFGFDDDGDDFLAGAPGAEVQLDLVEENADADDEIAVDLGEAAAGGEAVAAAEEVDEARRALLLYQEGTAEEQIYPFTGDVLTIGRGRDNDIQIKNDSKVSRFHCRLFRRGGNFYIEDNKSSNGTLVNGELITERRLFGGEEVIIGETFFRFRIM